MYNTFDLLRSCINDDLSERNNGNVVLDHQASSNINAGDEPQLVENNEDLNQNDSSNSSSGSGVMDLE